MYSLCSKRAGMTNSMRKMKRRLKIKKKKKSKRKKSGLCVETSNTFHVQASILSICKVSCVIKIRKNNFGLYKLSFDYKLEIDFFFLFFTMSLRSTNKASK